MNSNRKTASAVNGGDSAAPSRHSKQPKYSRFTQQELPACKPLLTPGWVMAIFMIVGPIFISIGVVSLVASHSVVEIVSQYETNCLPPSYRVNKNAKLAYIKNSTIPKNCTLILKVPKNMKHPIYIYYQLDNFYQNHRRYVNSRNDQQLMNAGSGDTTKDCDPEATGNNRLPIIPCGLIAWSLFNDTYNFSRGDTSLTVNKKDISWKSDREHRFGKDVFPQNFQNGTLIGGASLDPSIPLSGQEDLLVWMRPAAFPIFRKLYGWIGEDLQENDNITVNLLNNYNTYTFDGTKKVVLSNSNFLGGKNNFLGIAYLSVGGLCFFLAMVFLLMHINKPRPLGDTEYFSWNGNRPQERSS
jgi:hypothetical protein